MRTNQERVAEIFQRAATYQTELTHTDSKWKQPWVRALASVLVVIVLFGSGFGLFMGLWHHQNFQSFDKMYIANFAKYKAIGAGNVHTSAKQVLQTQSLNVSATNTVQDMYLVGVDQNNNVERCRVSLNNHQGAGDKTYEIGYHIYAIYSFDRYTFVSFTKEANRSVDYYNFEYDDSAGDYSRLSYVIDNATGKFYSLSVLSGGIYLGQRGYVNTWEAPSLFTGMESDDSVFITLGMDSYGQGEEHAIYRVYVQNDNLVLEEMFDYSLNLDVEDYFVDKYNNIYLLDNSGIRRSDGYDSLPIKYIVSHGRLINADKIGLNDTSVFRSVNGICYNQERTKYFNANGELVDNDFDGCGYFFEKNDKVKTINNVDYYFTNTYSKLHGGYNKYELYRITWTDDVKFNVQKIEYSRAITIKDYVVTQDYIYIIEENEVSRIAITTGNIEPLNSDYTFTSIQTDYLGNVIFNGNDTSMNKIMGIITNAGEISILTKARDYQIYYIAPVN